MILLKKFELVNMDADYGGVSENSLIYGLVYSKFISGVLEVFGGNLVNGG